MAESQTLHFGDRSAAASYDAVLVPILFEPWAVRLLEEYPAWRDRHVLDLATGTGVVAHLIAERVGPTGRVIAADLNPEMLALARRRCAGVSPDVEFVTSPAAPLAVPAACVDVVVCQQGFQFFPDRPAAAGEMARVLRPGGRVLASVWRSLAECEFFNAVCGALAAVGAGDLAGLMRMPFDHLSGDDLAGHFVAARFTNVRVNEQAREFVLEGGFPQAIDVAYATPIGPKLRELPADGQARFRKALVERLQELSEDGVRMGRMTANVLSAEKPG